MRDIIHKYKEKKYWRKRANKWENFKIYNKELQCGLVKECKSTGYTPRLWEYDCNNCSYEKNFFDKYGCMYVKGFMNY